MEVAECLKNVSGQKLYTISVCISQQCSRLGQFSPCIRMDLALSKSYFSGKEFNILSEE
ncbi:MAG: hypothetical protein ACLUOI_37810 [Eisenbergiella sp.]